jgi:2-polyprenyl-3-methyl-5-hydroxy-6-metoxy-1,4-benzoquinol methylase
LSAQLQYGFSQNSPGAYDRSRRERKAAKVIAILAEAMGPLQSLDLLDIGCSTGLMTNLYARHFRTAIGTDIDLPALRFAAQNVEVSNVAWSMMDSQRLGFPDGSFDVVTCTHIYEHVPDAQALMDEIYRVLKPGGVCFFSAGNRFSWMEPHYRLPLLSVVPKRLAHWYLRILGRGDHYYETHLSLGGLRKLVRRFNREDYTVKVITDPARYHAEDMLPPGSAKQTTAIGMARWLYALVPTYLWILRKNTTWAVPTTVSVRRDTSSADPLMRK